MQGQQVYTTHSRGINVTWGGFMDPQTGILFYRYAVGSKSYESDIQSWEDVGLHTGNNLIMHYFLLFSTVS